MKKLILIDGNAIFHRAFHALPPFKTSKGEFTNAIYGFMKMLIDLLKREKPEYVAVAFDTAQKTFRHIEYEEYKAQRSAPPPELYPQLPRLKEGLAALNIAIFELAGYEADDIIGTMATMAEKRPDLHTIIVTGDRDAFQLVTEKTHVMMPLKGLSEVIDYTPEKVKEKTGLTPAQVIDYKALKGDPSDNIKGINGIGEKQAVTLLQKYETLENIYEHLDELTPAQREKFTTGREDALFSKKLATIIRDVPLEIDLDQCNVRKAPSSKIKAFCESLEFKGLMKKFEELKDFIEIESSGIESKLQPDTVTASVSGKTSLQQSLF